MQVREAPAHQLSRARAFGPAATATTGIIQLRSPAQHMGSDSIWGHAVIGLGQFASGPFWLYCAVPTPALATNGLRHSSVQLVCGVSPSLMGQHSHCEQNFFMQQGGLSASVLTGKCL